MSVVLRLTRKGTVKKPFYRVVAADKRFSRDGRFIEILGTYDPKKDPAEIKLEKDRVTYWLTVGAQPSKTVASIINKAGVDLKKQSV